MAKYNYDSLKTAQEQKANNSQGKNYPRVGYFWLSDKKPSAIVRFDVSSPDDLEIVDVHNIKLTKEDGTNYYRYVACLRNNDEPFKNCPLCSQNVKTRSTQVFVTMIEYYIDKEGKVVASPCVWSRFSGFADELVTLLNQYGDLKEHLFKVSREKTGNKTKYSVLYQPEMGIYTEAAGYTKDFSAFNGLLINKHSYMERTYEELETFVTTGVMASRKPVGERNESKNLEELIQDTQEEQEVEEALGMSQEHVEAPIPTNEDIPVQVASQSTTTPAPSIVESRVETSTRVQPSVQQVEDVNPTISRRRRYNFSEEDTKVANSFTNPF